MVTLDGRPVSTAELLPLALTNLGHFTTMRVDADGTVRGLSLHMERLARDCATVFGAELDTARVRAFVRRSLTGHESPCVVRVTIYDPSTDLGHLAEADDPHVLVTVRAAATGPLPPLRVRSVRYERDLPPVKHVGLLGALHARRTAQFAGYDDALFIDRDGHVTEGSSWNVGFVDQGGAVVWPLGDVLPGVTMALLQESATHRVAVVTPEQAGNMAAAFATNTSFGVRPIASLDGIELAVEHPTLERLSATYLGLHGARP
ncbi:aminotransferase class IV family protein [Streptomyces sedi]|uniref:Aminotransferase n=1 Tax=Streptomyces sedi TaxID=555059 RepID=A0A5C4VEC5_9ACTN|nr:aminotransferase class IV family protein [Streptomyces sedi]TNM34287.1 aminotransferase [Streptomyces sedi]